MCTYVNSLFFPVAIIEDDSRVLYCCFTLKFVQKGVEREEAYNLKIFNKCNVIFQALISDHLVLIEGGPNGAIRINTEASDACSGIQNCDIYLKLQFSDGPQPT